MKKEEIKEFVNKEVKLIMKNQFVYSGYIELISEDSLRFKDKFNELVIISLDQISLIRLQSQREKEVSS